MHISHESAAQTEARLRRVIAEADLLDLALPHAFEEFDAEALPTAMRPDALALVRDGSCWSQLVPARDGAVEPVRVFRFHFPAGLDNSGFVGWLASHLKRATGSGVFVVCGQNSQRGGIYDYWGCPWEVGDAVLRAVRSLITQGRAELAVP